MEERYTHEEHGSMEAREKHAQCGGSPDVVPERSAGKVWSVSDVSDYVVLRGVVDARSRYPTGKLHGG